MRNRFEERIAKMKMPVKDKNFGGFIRVNRKKVDIYFDTKISIGNSSTYPSDADNGIITTDTTTITGTTTGTTTGNT